MITITMKQAETYKTLLTKAGRGTTWLENKMDNATKKPAKKLAKKKVTKKKVAKASKKKVSKKKPLTAFGGW